MHWNGQFGATGRTIGTEAWTARTPIETNFLGYEGVETQAIAGLKVHRMIVDTIFLQENSYIPLFDQAFTDLPWQERYTRITSGLAIATYERTLLANQSPWQQWLYSPPMAMSETKKRSALLFFGKAACAPCHGGPALNSNMFFAYGMNDLDSCPDPVFAVKADSPAHFGRGSFTGQQSDMYKFKVPQLYNLKDSPFMGHGSHSHPLNQSLSTKTIAFRKMLVSLRNNSHICSSLLNSLLMKLKQLLHP